MANASWHSGDQAHLHHSKTLHFHDELLSIIDPALIQHAFRVDLSLNLANDKNTCLRNLARTHVAVQPKTKDSRQIKLKVTFIRRVGKDQGYRQFPELKCEGDLYPTQDSEEDTGRRRGGAKEGLGVGERNTHGEIEHRGCRAS